MIRRTHAPRAGRGWPLAGPRAAAGAAGRGGRPQGVRIPACTTPSASPAYTGAQRPRARLGAESEGRVIPFCRLDPAEEAIAEGERAIGAGARGIKLHPRAQAVRFRRAARWMPSSRLAEDASVPILIHAGRGMPPIADGLGRSRLAAPGGGVDPRARRDLRSGGSSPRGLRITPGCSTTAPASSPWT